MKCLYCNGEIVVVAPLGLGLALGAQPASRLLLARLVGTELLLLICLARYQNGNLHCRVGRVALQLSFLDVLSFVQALSLLL